MHECREVTERMPRVIRGALVQASWTGDKESMIQKHEERAHEAAAQGAQAIGLQLPAGIDEHKGVVHVQKGDRAICQGQRPQPIRDLRWQFLHCSGRDAGCKVGERVLHAFARASATGPHRPPVPAQRLEVIIRNCPLLAEIVLVDQQRMGQRAALRLDALVQ